MYGINIKLPKQIKTAAEQHSKQHPNKNIINPPQKTNPNAFTFSIVSRTAIMARTMATRAVTIVSE